MHPLSYLHFQLQLEGIGLNGQHMVPEGPAPPLVLIARLRTQELITYFDASLAGDLQAQLANCLHETGFPHVGPLLEILESAGQRAQAEHFVTHLFPSLPPTSTDRVVSRYAAHDARLQAFELDGLSAPVFGMEQAGTVAAMCLSIRENDHCGEAWAVTLPEHRRRGLGKHVVQAWARSLIQAGKIPFYSCKVDNLASLGLARGLGLQPVFEEITISMVRT